MKKSILASSPFLIVNKTLLQNIGIDASLVLSDLVQKEQYFKDSSQNNGGYFFNITNDISCSTTLSYYQIKQALSVLEKWGMIKIILKGVPAKKHFKIDKSQILNFLTSSIQKTSELDCKNFNNKILKNSNSINNNKEIIIKNNIDIRKKDFINEVKELENPNYHIEFIDYWCEDNGKKMRWELERTWNTNLRLKRWAKNQSKFSKKSTMPDFYDLAYVNRIKEDQAQLDKFYIHLKSLGYERKETVTGYVKWIKR